MYLLHSNRSLSDYDISHAIRRAKLTSGLKLTRGFGLGFHGVLVTIDYGQIVGVHPNWKYWVVRRAESGGS